MIAAKDDRSSASVENALHAALDRVARVCIVQRDVTSIKQDTRC